MAGTDDDRLAEIRARLDNRLGYSRPYDGGPVHQPNEAMLIHEDVPYLLDRVERAEARIETSDMAANISMDVVAEYKERAEAAEAERVRLVAALTPLVEAALELGNEPTPKNPTLGTVVGTVFRAGEAAAAVLQEMKVSA